MEVAGHMDVSRYKIFEHQSRSFSEGTLEYINDQWVFFDDESEEASLLEDFLFQEVEVFSNHRWRKGKLIETDKVKLSNEILDLHSATKIRIRKNLVYSLERLLEDLHEDAFLQFVMTLNSMEFSIYDCIYCHNHLSFLKEKKNQNGVNMMIFDNGEVICAVQHHFEYFKRINDRFEFTLSTGKRVVIEKLA